MDCSMVMIVFSWGTAVFVCVSRVAKVAVGADDMFITCTDACVFVLDAWVAVGVGRVVIAEGAGVVACMAVGAARVAMLAVGAVAVCVYRVAGVLTIGVNVTGRSCPCVTVGT
jgi:hypothetical protein